MHSTFKLILLLTAIACADGRCPSMRGAWECAISDSPSYGRTCITRADIQRKVSKAALLSRPLLLAMEGPRYDDLFSDCDADGNNCISLKEAIRVQECQRDCRWRALWKDIMCTE